MYSLLTLKGLMEIVLLGFVDKFQVMNAWYGMIYFLKVMHCFEMMCI